MSPLAKKGSYAEQNLPLSKSYRSTFKWGNPEQFKHPDKRLYAFLKEELGLTDLGEKRRPGLILRTLLFELRKVPAIIYVKIYVNGNLQWRKVEGLFMALGAEKDEGSGSAVTFFLNGKRADFHRPHPAKEALRYRVKAAREFLEMSGVKP